MNVAGFRRGDFADDRSRVDAPALIVVCNRRFDRLLGEHRTVDFDWRQAVERFDNRLVGEFERLGDRLALDEVGRHRACCNRRAATEGLKLHVGDDAVVDLDVHLHDIAAFCVADLADAVRVLYLTHVVRVHKVFHYLGGVFHCHTRYLLNPILCSVYRASASMVQVYPFFVQYSEFAYFDFHVFGKARKQFVFQYLHPVAPRMSWFFIVCVSVKT